MPPVPDIPTACQSERVPPWPWGTRLPLPRRPRFASNEGRAKRGRLSGNQLPRDRGPCMTVLLSIQGLTKGFGPRPLFTDLSLDLRAGERVGLIGPNGSGKSTLLRVLAGLEESDAGTRSVSRTANLGHVAQDDVFPDGQTAREVVLAALAGEAGEERERQTRAAVA